MLNLTGSRCPQLLITIIETMRTMAAGEVLQIIATDLTAPSHITAWARQSDQKLLDLYEEDGCFIFWLQREPVAEWAELPG
jgi:TusA-related sulfurtransferase